MIQQRNDYLIFAACACALAALAHLGCILFGGAWYRFFGAGEAMAQLADAGSPEPTRITLAIAGILVIWCLYALSGAQLIWRLPLLRSGLCLIAALFLFRGLAFVVLIPLFPGNSLSFWLVSSGICLLIGGAFAMGIRQAWPQLSAHPRLI